MSNSKWTEQNLGFILFQFEGFAKKKSILGQICLTAMEDELV